MEFTVLRLLSGALTLWIVVGVSRRNWHGGTGGSWASALSLFIYAGAFSLAYITLGAGTGALILFASVQITMLLAGLLGGEKLRALQWIGFALAFSGLVYLVSPGLKAPPLEGSTLMTVAGIAWGTYSLRGRGVRDPIGVTADNFIKATPLALPLMVIVWVHGIQVSPAGAMWAILSGSVTSGLGYALWYSALRNINATIAAIVQLSVPIFAAAGGILMLGERPSLRLLFSGVATLGGVGLSILAPKKPVSSTS